MSGIIGTSHSKSKVIGRSKDIVTIWVNIAGQHSTPYARDSFNVSCIGDNATGDYTINFLKTLNNTNYSFTGGAGYGNQNATLNLALPDNLATSTSQTTTSLRVKTTYQSTDAADADVACVQIFGG